MVQLRNLRPTTDHGERGMAADFTLPDGRVGSVSVPQHLFDQHGERLLQEEADATARWARLHRYQPPEADRRNELL